MGHCLFFQEFLGEPSPLLVRRGGCGIKKILAKPTLAPQTGWSLTRYTPGVTDHPVRSNKGGFAAFSLCRVHPSSRGGTTLAALCLFVFVVQNRVRRNALRSRVLFPSTTNSATASPIAAECLKP